jgi:hypothetical protein
MKHGSRLSASHQHMAHVQLPVDIISVKSELNTCVNEPTSCAREKAGHAASSASNNQAGACGHIIIIICNVLGELGAAGTQLSKVPSLPAPPLRIFHTQSLPSCWTVWFSLPPSPFRHQSPAFSTSPVARAYLSTAHNTSLLHSSSF